MHASRLQQLASVHDRNADVHAGIAFYLYFLATQREFAYREWKNQMMTRLQVSYTFLFMLLMRLCLDVNTLFALHMQLMQVCEHEQNRQLLLQFLEQWQVV